MRTLDSHVHLDLFDENEREVLLKELKKQEIEALLIPGLSPLQYPSLCALVEKSSYPLYGSLGFHPWFLKREFLQFFPHQFPERIIAVGETGFDKASPLSLEEQKDFFHHAIDIAAKHKKLLMIHLVHYPESALHILQSRAKELPAIILHSWSKNEQITKSFLSIENTMFSFSGGLLENEKIEKSFHMIPKDRILTETDSPDQYFPSAPFKRNHERANTPLNIKAINQFCLNLRPDLKEEQFYDNFVNLLKLVQAPPIS